MDKKLSVTEAYQAMYIFLQNLYERTNSDDLGGFLGEMSLLQDEKPADPAVWEDWIKAIKQLKNLS